jgi:phosphoserine phosphatase RsbU/P
VVWCSSPLSAQRPRNTIAFGFSDFISAKSTRVNPDGDPTGQRQRLDYRYAIELGLVFAAYFVAGKVGLAIPLTSGNVSPVWPPSGIALAALLILGFRVWPAIAFGALVVNYFTRIPHSAAIGIAMGNTLGPVTGAWLLRRKRGFQLNLTHLRDVLTLVVIGGFAGTAISASVGTTALFLTKVNAWAHFTAAWMMWWVGDAVGVLIITPLVLVFPKLFLIVTELSTEFVVLLLGATVTSLLIFRSNIGMAIGAEVLVLTLVPFILWSAIRFELPGTVVVNAVICAIAVWGEARGLGPLTRGNPIWSAALLQSFLILIAVPGMTLATAIAERAQMAREQAAQFALQQSERRYGGILESANEGIWMLDAQFSTKFVNHRLAELLGYTVEEMIGRPLFDFLFPAEVDQEKEALQRTDCDTMKAVENRFRKKDGSELWATVSTAPIFSPEGTFEGAAKWFIDRADEVPGADEKRSALEMVMLLSRAVQQTRDSIMITDRAGIIEYVNPAFESITGFAPDEALGKTPRIVKSGRYGTDFYKELWDCISEGKPFRGTLINRKKTGELYWGEQTITPVTDETGNITHYVSVVRDGTDSHKKQEQEVQLRLAREVQQRFYTRPISVPGLDIDAAAYPADETGGDYFDMIPVGDNDLYVGIGDISGHGLGSAILMALMRAHVRSFAELQLGPGEMLARTNRMLMADLEHGQYATLLLLRIGHERSSLIYSSAGHPPGFLLNCNGEVEHVLDSTAIPLGLFNSCEFPAIEVPLRPPQILVLVTDGITEAATADDQDFGSAGVVEHVRAHYSKSASEIAHGLCQAARDFEGSEHQRDDLTSVVLKIQ